LSVLHQRQEAVAMWAIRELQQQRELILGIAARHGARRVRVFGSAARGDTHPGSDLDLLVAFDAGRNLLDQIGLAQELEDALGCPIDVVAEGGINRHLEARILAEAQPL